MNTFQIVRAFGLLMILNGCYIERDVDMTPPLQTNVKRITLSEHIPFSAQRRILTHQEAKRLREDIHQLSGNGPIYARLVVRKLHTKFDDSMTDPRVASVAKFLKHHGVEQHRIKVIEEDSNPYKTKTGNSMWIGIDQYVTLLPRCPGFDAQVIDRKVPPEGETNFGCSNEYNFAKMVAEPKDIYKGHPLSPGDPAVNSNAIERLRTDKVRALKVEKAQETSSSVPTAQ